MDITLHPFYASRIDRYKRFYAFKVAQGLTHDDAMARLIQKFHPDERVLRMLLHTLRPVH